MFATVGSPEKADLARAAGADHVIDYRAQDFGDAVEAAAGPRPLDVVYDGVGSATFARGLDLLRPRGTMVTFGNASGPVDPVAPLTLMRKGSLYLTRPTLHDYTATTEELRTRAADLFGARRRRGPRGPDRGTPPPRRGRGGPPPAGVPDHHRQAPPRSLSPSHPSPSAVIEEGRGAGGQAGGQRRTVSR